MIYTVTFNPSIDYDMEFEHVSLGNVNRASAAHLSAGGKGINVSIILSALGAENVIMGFIAGFTGREIEYSLQRAGFKCDLIRLKRGMSRINVKLHTDVTTDLNAPGPDISKDELSQLNEKLDKLVEGDILVLAGAIPACLPDYTYSQIAERMKKKGVRVVIDAAGPLLSTALTAEPYLVKPNRHELGELFSVRINGPEDAATYAEQMIDMGAHNVLVSLDHEGAVLATDTGETLYCHAPEGPVINPVGAGDSMVAGALYALTHNMTPAQVLKLGVAAGSATTFSHNFAGKDDIFAINGMMQEPETI